MKKIVIYNIGALFCAMSFFGVVEDVSADAWWGEGYRSPEWVRAHGGTTISYTVKGTSHTDKYKAMMFRDGQYVEVEFGKHATFDDAKSGTYLINFYKCKDCMKHKFDKKTKIRDKDKLVASITIVARPGEANTLIFDASNNTVQRVGRSGYVAPVDPFIAKQAKAKEDEGKKCQYGYTQEQMSKLEQALLLSREVDSEQFRENNINTGILPQFLANK